MQNEKSRLSAAHLKKEGKGLWQVKWETRIPWPQSWMEELPAPPVLHSQGTCLLPRTALAWLCWALGSCSASLPGMPL